MIIHNLPNPVDEFKQYAGKEVTIPMSGGADSTLLAAKAMQAGCHVELLRLIAQTPTGVDEERKWDDVYSALGALSKDYKVKLTTRKVTVPYNANNFSALYTQMAWWLAVLPMAMGRTGRVIAMGWLASDGTKTLAEDFGHSIVSARRAAWMDEAVVLFPILEWTKDHVLSCLSQEFPTLVPHVWWCENGAHWRFKRQPLPRDVFGYEAFEDYHEQCGKCHSCVDTLAFFHHWNGKRIDGDRGYAPMNNPPDRLTAVYPRILVQYQTSIVAEAVLRVAKHYNKQNVTIEYERLVLACNTPPYLVEAVHPKFGTDNRDVPAQTVTDALMNRHINPTHYQRAIEHLAFYTLRYLEMADMKSAGTRLKEIARLLQAETDTLWPIPQWYLERDVREEVITGV